MFLGGQKFLHVFGMMTPMSAGGSQDFAAYSTSTVPEYEVSGWRIRAIAAQKGSYISSICTAI